MSCTEVVDPIHTNTTLHAQIHTNFLTHGSDKAGRLESDWVSAGGIASEQGHLELIDVNLSRTISIAHAEVAVRLCITDINIQKR